MICPICELKVEEFDEPDECIRAVCCNCRTLITLREISDDEVCQDDTSEI